MQPFLGNQVITSEDENEMNKSPDTQNDSRIMEEVKAGRVEKLALLFERYHVQLYNFFLRFTGNRVVSEDLVQEVFYRILKYRNTYQDEGNFAVWMYRIARNSHYDHLREIKNHISLEDSKELALDGEHQPEKRSEAEDEVSLVRKALKMLSPGKREILLMTRYQNLKYKEIAGILGCREGTVKAHVHRALRDLGKCVQQLQGEKS